MPGSSRFDRISTASDRLGDRPFSRRVFAMLVGVLFASMFAGGLPQQAAASYSYVDTNILNLRDGPGIWADILDRMYQWEEVSILAGPTDDGWYQVDYYGEVGWAFGGYLNVDGYSGWDSAPATGGGGYVEEWIDVDRSAETVTLYRGDEVVDSFWAAMGYDQSADGFYSTAIGTYYVYSKVSSLHWTAWGKAYITDWVGFDASRYNGFHSYSLDSNGNVLPNGAGKTGGCVALAPGAADELFNFAYEGMRVEVHW